MDCKLLRAVSNNNVMIMVDVVIFTAPPYGGAVGLYELGYYILLEINEINTIISNHK